MSTKPTTKEPRQRLMGFIGIPLILIIMIGMMIVIGNKGEDGTSDSITTTTIAGTTITKPASTVNYNKNHDNYYNNNNHNYNKNSYNYHNK